jgi:hypothetical protein
MMMQQKTNVASNVPLQQFFGKLPHIPSSSMHLMLSFLVVPIA